MAQLYTRIFVALDGSAAQSAVIERALQLAEANNAQVLFGHVVDSLPSDIGGVNYQMLIEEEEKLMRERLAPTFERLEVCETISGYEFKICAGRVGDALFEHLIEPYNPDLIVCGERGYSDFKYAFVGSVSKRLIRDAECDVLVVKSCD